MSDFAMSARPVAVGTAVFEPGQVGMLTQFLPPEVIDEILRATGGMHRRLRLLPARVVVYFVLALTLFPGRGYGRVWDTLVEGMITPILVSLGALRQARRRLGVAPLAALWDWACGPLAWPGRHGAFYRRWRLLAWDGTTLDVPDTDANAARFRTVGGSAGRSGYRKLIALGLIECGTRAFVGAALGADEITLARRLLGKLAPGHLVLADRGFYSWSLWHAAAAAGADLLWRARNEANLPVSRRLPDGSYLSRFPSRKQHRDQPDPLPVRVIEATISIVATDGEIRTERYRLITTILDHRVAPAAELAELYARRWEIETAYYCWKTLQQGHDAVLRSKTPHGVEQEVYAYFITCQMLRALAHDAADHAGLQAHQIRFTAVLDAIADSISNHHLNNRLQTPPAEQYTQTLARAARRPNPPTRPPRHNPRARKRPVSKFPSKRPDTRTSQRVSYIIETDQTRVSPLPPTPTS